jgi:hypothetical protein
VNIGQAVVAILEFKGQLFMINPEAVQHHRVQVVQVVECS